MPLLFLCPTKDAQPWKDAILSVDPAIDLRVWPDVGDRSEITFAIVWNHPFGSLQAFPNLQAISSLGAGIDHLNNDPDIPPGVPIARIVDPDLIQSMSLYVTTAVLTYFRSFTLYSKQKAAQQWKPEPPKLLKNNKIGIMGIGALGSDAALKLSGLGFSVHGWSNSRKDIAGLTYSFAGRDELPAFLKQSNILICLLPLTSETTGILNKSLFSQLPDKAYLINAARGAHLVDADLLSAIDSGKIKGACLDVFNEEPLPGDHSFWVYPGISVTPHIASITNPVSAAKQVVENYHRATSGKPLLHSVDLSREY